MPVEMSPRYAALDVSVHEGQAAGSEPPSGPTLAAADMETQKRRLTYLVLGVLAMMACLIFGVAGVTGGSEDAASTATSAQDKDSSSGSTIDTASLTQLWHPSYAQVPPSDSDLLLYSTPATATTSISSSSSSGSGARHVMRVPMAVIEGQESLLLVSQLTHGLGSRTLWMDAGRMLSQLVVTLELSSPTSSSSAGGSGSDSGSDSGSGSSGRWLHVVASNLDYRGGSFEQHWAPASTDTGSGRGSVSGTGRGTDSIAGVCVDVSVCRSYASSVVASLPVLEATTTTTAGSSGSGDGFVYVSLDELASEAFPSVHSHTPVLSALRAALSGAYGAASPAVTTVSTASSVLAHTTGTSSSPFDVALQARVVLRVSAGSEGRTPIPSELAALSPDGATLSLGVRTSLMRLDRLVSPASARAHHPQSGVNAVAYRNESATGAGSSSGVSDGSGSTSNSIGSDNTVHLMAHYALTVGSVPTEVHRSSSSSSSGGASTSIRRESSSSSSSSAAAAAAVWRVVRVPMLYYCIDDAAPGDPAQAMLEGTQWWAAALERTGLPAGTMVVEACPPDYDPFSLAPPVLPVSLVSPAFTTSGSGATSTLYVPAGVGFVEWIHRDQRSYSVGQRLADPRTGAILRGTARLGSLRMEKDAELLTAMATVRDTASVDAAVRARTRLLAAHEVGHTLGLAHNFAGSSCSSGGTMAGCSVMDYAPPLVVRNTSGVVAVLEVSLDSYLSEIGAFDLVSLRAAYGNVSSSSSSSSSSGVGGGGGSDAYPVFEAQRHALQSLIAAESASGYLFLSDGDAAAGVDARGSKWDLSPGDDGGGAGVAAAHPIVTALLLAVDVRAMALEQLWSPTHPLPPSAAVVADVFLWHRYQISAAAKLVGGFAADDPALSSALRSVPAATQEAALEALMQCLAPAALVLPPPLQRVGTGAFEGYQGRASEEMESRIGAVTDAVVAAETLVGYVVVDLLLSAPRLNRLALSSSPLALSTVIDALLDAVGLGEGVSVAGISGTTVATAAATGPQLATDILHTAQSAAVAALVGAWTDVGSSPAARALVRYAGLNLSSRLTASDSTTTAATGGGGATVSADDVLWAAHASTLVQALSAVQAAVRPPPPPIMPDGAPI